MGVLWDILILILALCGIGIIAAGKWFPGVAVLLFSLFYWMIRDLNNTDDKDG